MKVGHFEICKSMAMTGGDIRRSGMENVVNLRKVKAGTQVTIGVAGDVVAAIGLENRFVGGLFLCDREQYFATKLRLEQIRDTDTPAIIARRIVSAWIDPKPYGLQPDHEAELQRAIAGALEWALNGATGPYTEGPDASRPLPTGTPAENAQGPIMATEDEIERLRRLR